MKTVRIVSLFLALLSLLLVGCGGSEDPSVAFCDALTELSNTGPTIAALGEVVDMIQIIQLGNAMDTDWQSLSTAAEKMDDATQSAFAPYDELYTAIPAITQETAAPVARSSLEAKNAIIMDAYNELYPGQCQ